MFYMRIADQNGKFFGKLQEQFISLSLEELIVLVLHLRKGKDNNLSC